ncbi:MAG: glycosyltransferase [Xanthomonadales bacterium]|nr:glycosyltransferase [Xanthomonadales bacterium]
MPPRVSVILPVRDGGCWLRVAVDSILAQTLTELELLVVDDHSADDTIARLPRDDSRLRILASDGKGVSRAFNTGLAAARAPYVARMDADDIALPQRLERQVALLASRPDLALCGACVEIFRDDGAPLEGGNRRYQTWLNACREPGDIRRALFVESPIPNPTALFRREALQALGGYADPPWPEDYDLFLRADARGLRMGKPDEVLLRWREHDASLTRRDPRYARQRFQAAKAHYLAHGRLDAARPTVIWGAGPGGRLLHDLLRDEGFAVTGFLDVHPRRLGGEKRGLPVWPIERLANLRDAFVLVAVGTAGVRPEIRARLDERGRAEGADYLFAC